MRAFIRFDENADVVTLRSVGDDDVREIRLELSKARMGDIVSSEGVVSMGLDPARYPQSLKVTSDLFDCDLFTE
jgi:hypothetical protein